MTTESLSYLPTYLQLFYYSRVTAAEHYCERNAAALAAALELVLYARTQALPCALSYPTPATAVRWRSASRRFLCLVYPLENRYPL